jgi:hypothetical protein
MMPMGWIGAIAVASRRLERVEFDSAVFLRQSLVAENY